MNSDMLLALKLQREFELEDQRNNQKKQFVTPKTKKPLKRSRENSPPKHNSADHEGDDLNSTCNLVHPEWETLDPTPDIFTMFSAFDIKFFQNKLRCVELEWSKKMYQCAGICYQRRNGFGMSCTIRLSEPLLKLRPRKDLVETLLHEMIHAFLFILNIREGNGGHGPNFNNMMNKINKSAGTNISVYHSFHDEVELYKTHWWRCNGVCQHRGPFYGYIRRTSNRAPGANDRWWSQHLSSCSGTFMKIKGPEMNENDKTQLKKKKNNKAPSGKDIRNFFPTNNAGGGGTHTNRGSNTVVVVKPNQIPVTAPTTNKTNTNKNLGNVIGFKDINSSPPSSTKNVVPVFSGNGKSLGQSTGSSLTDVTTNIRNIWANRFPSPENNTKRRKTEEPVKPISSWNIIDDDIAIHETQIEIFDVSDEDSNDEVIKDVKPEIQSLPQQTSQERQHTIKQEILGSDDEGDDDDIILIDDEFDDDLEASMELADSSVIDDIFGKDTLMDDFNKNNEIFQNANKDDEIISCPLCQEKMARETLEIHLDGCSGITVSIKPKNYGLLIQKAVPTSFINLSSSGSRNKNSSVKQTNPPTAKKIQRPSTSTSSNLTTSTATATSKSSNSNKFSIPLSKTSVAEELALCGYSEEEIRKVVADMNEVEHVMARNFDSELSESDSVEKKPCPVCERQIDVNLMNQHLDDCLLIDSD